MEAEGEKLQAEDGVLGSFVKSRKEKEREMSNNLFNAYSKGNKHRKIGCKQEKHGKEFVKAD